MKANYLPIILTVAFVYLLFGCNRYTSKRQYREVYVEQFKLTYLRKILRIGFNETEAVRAVLKDARGGFTEPLLSEDDEMFIDSVVRTDNFQMVQDSINRRGRVAEGAQGKHVLPFVMNRLESGWLNKMAKKRFKVFNVPPALRWSD
jgi:hypothetical protein